MIQPLVALPLAQISPAAETALRVAYGTLLACQLLFTFPNARRFFSTERHGGYMESTAVLDIIHTPWTAYALCSLWLACALGIVLGVWLLPCALVNFILARYFFVGTRWRSILRGMGAPGHMNFWLAALTLFLAVAQNFDVDGILHAATILTFRVDFALIMLAAGIYKLSSGYAHNYGFQQGLANPWWGFWSRWTSRMKGLSPVFALLNHSGYIVEIICGVLFFVPPIAPYAGVALGASFILIACMIRLTFLAEMVAACCLLYFTPGTGPAEVLSRFVHGPAAHQGNPTAWIVFPLTLLLLAYLALLPLAYSGMSVNFYAKRRLPEQLQRALDAWCRFFGLILWRVFTSDVINFYCTITAVNHKGAKRNLATLRPFARASGMRFMHVGEFICLASLFTTLKYYPADRDLFRRRILRYVTSLSPASGENVIFSYIAIRLMANRFDYVHVRDFVCDPAHATVEERVIDSTYDVSAPASHSPVWTGNTPGSYAPLPVK